ncbi:hypothetical protein [Planotetraspora phitsanulokensis]|uniref:hypothetical protein n=2 Tax=Planotetraspora phitsanulokensis TaxID=575192 RepID=UPI0019511ECE|nr:hypothetical protein [Planotetraspora phitsanulokensis]
MEMTFAIAVIPSSQAVSVGRPAQHPKLIAGHRPVPMESRHFEVGVMHRHSFVDRMQMGDRVPRALSFCPDR